jgi:hypothetical protein
MNCNHCFVECHERLADVFCQAFGTPEIKIEIVDIEEDPIRNYQVPSIVNYVNVWRFGNDVYVDMGLVTVEQRSLLKPSSAPGRTVSVTASKERTRVALMLGLGVYATNEPTH